MSKRQRMKNRATAAKLDQQVGEMKTCLNCGELTRRGHFVGPSFGEDGFWACPKYYGADGRRIEEPTNDN